MSYHFIDKKDPRIDVMFQGMEKMEKMLAKNGRCPQIPLQRGTLPHGRGTFQNTAGKQAHIAGIPYFRGDSLLHGTREGSL